MAVVWLLPLAVLAVMLGDPGTAIAHEKWFYDAAAHPTRWSEALRWPQSLGLAVVAAVTIAGWLGWRARGHRDIIPGPEAFGATEAGLVRFYALVPLILGVHAGAPLIILGISGQLFSPNNVLEGAPRYWLGLAEVGVGLGLICGALTRLAGVVLAAVWLAGIGVAGVEPMLENVHYVGFAAFFVFTGRGPYAIDRLLFPAFEPSPRIARRAMSTLRLATGLGLIVVAFTEKLANPGLALAFLQRYPLNFTPWMGLPMSDEMFVACAGAAELLIGVWIALGLFPRPVILIVWFLINMTLTVFNWVELLGHLPIYGVMAILLIWTPRDADQRRWMQGVLGRHLPPRS